MRLPFEEGLIFICKKEIKVFKKEIKPLKKEINILRKEIKPLKKEIKTLKKEINVARLFLIRNLSTIHVYEKMCLYSNIFHCVIIS